MNKKFLLSLMILTAFICSGSSQVFAAPAVPKINAQTEVKVDTNNNEYTEAEIIKRVSLKNKFQKSPEAQIQSFIKKYNHYSEKNNFAKLKEMYCEDFINNDGFDKETLFKMMEMASGAYKNTKYSTEIEKIKITGKYAMVKARETASAETDNLTEKINDTGIVNSQTDYVDHLVKEGNKWKIQATEILSEEVSMKYGEAKNMNVEIISPACVPAGSEYEVSISANTPDGSFALGSIVNERIVFPQEQNKDIFRAIKNEKLARVLTANKDGKNEYTTISIALTRAEVEPPQVNINMTGMAFSMKRINVIPFSIKQCCSEKKGSCCSIKKDSCCAEKCK